MITRKNAQGSFADLQEKYPAGKGHRVWLVLPASLECSVVYGIVKAHEGWSESERTVGQLRFYRVAEIGFTGENLTCDRK